MILQQLHQIQHEHGYLPRPALVALAERLAVPLYRIQEVVSFYPHFRTTPPPEVEIHVCRDMSCQLARRGNDKIRGRAGAGGFDRRREGKRLSPCRASAAATAPRPPAFITHAAGSGHPTAT